MPENPHSNAPIAILPDGRFMSQARRPWVSSLATGKLYHYLRVVWQVFPNSRGRGDIGPHKAEKKAAYQSGGFVRQKKGVQGLVGPRAETKAAPRTREVRLQ